MLDQNRWGESDFAEMAGFNGFICPDCGGSYTVRHKAEDGRCIRCIDPEGVAKAERLEQLRMIARAHADMALKIVSARPGYHWMWRSEDAAWYARRAYQTCRRYQLAGGWADV